MANRRISRKTVRFVDQIHGRLMAELKQRQASAAHRVTISDLINESLGRTLPEIDARPARRASAVAEFREAR